MAQSGSTLEEVLREVDRLRRLVAEQAARIEQQSAEIAELRGRLSQTSRNSSRPPSTDCPNAPARSLRKASDRRPGGQPGHEPRGLSFASAPDAIVGHRPRACERCGEGLGARPVELASRHHITDVPPVRPHVTEHRVYAARCAGCGHLTRAPRPAGLPAAPTSYGPSVEALVAYLSARQYLPVARIAELLRECFGLRVSTGTVQAMVERAGRRMRGAVAAIKDAVAGAAVVGSDETPIREAGRRREAWSWQTADAVYMARGPSRSSEVHRREFPGGFPGAVLVTDRLAAQLNTPAEAHQVCLAHLMRACVGLAEAEGASFWPAELLTLLERVSHVGALGRVCEERERRRIAAELNKLLSDAYAGLPAREARLWRSLAADRERMLVCLERADVPPDNNASERAIRNLKVKLKVSGQWRSAAGAEAYLRLRSVIETAIRRGIEPLTALRTPATLGLQIAS